MKSKFATIFIFLFNIIIVLQKKKHNNYLILKINKI